MTVHGEFERAMVENSVPLITWLFTFPDDIQAWVIEFTGPMPKTKLLARIAANWRKPVQVDHSNVDDRRDVDAVVAWCSGTLYRLVLLLRAYGIISDLAEKGEAGYAASLNVSGGYRPDARGYLRYVPSPPETWLKSIFEGVEAARIRRCVVCNEFFWAGRRDQSACSLECGTLHRQRKFQMKRKSKGGSNRDETN
jgi:hypothetical protein